MWQKLFALGYNIFMNSKGLTSEQVQTKIEEGKVNIVQGRASNTISRILLKNTITVFNFVNLVLAIMVIIVGSYKNLLFIVIAIANTLISIVNEVRAKRIVDKMRLTTEQRPTVIRDGKTIQINQSNIVEGDLLVYSLGDQILVDCRLEEGVVEVNESFITGEQEALTKQRGDKLISGSFVVSGTCKATAMAVGSKSELNRIEQTAHTVKSSNSKLFNLMNNIVKYISFALIPIGILLLFARFRVDDTTTEVAVTSTVAALINMIPEGLILLTSSVLALATIRLSRKNVLVQDLYSIETLARVNTICLDKTGTLTTGRMRIHDFTLPDGTVLTGTTKTPSLAEKTFETALASILSHQAAENATVTALKQKFARKSNTCEIEDVIDIINFSSERKYSGIRTSKATYLLGAIDFITDDKFLIKKIKSASEGYRTRTVVKRITEGTRSKSSATNDEQGSKVSPVTIDQSELDENKSFLSSSDKLLGFIRLEDEIRPDAKQIINYFYENDIAVKIISGDDLEAVTAIANRVGVKEPKGVNLSDYKNPNYDKLVKEYNIFTRVTPTQKKDLIKAIKDQGSTVAMTGDGVNDILAMKESDVSIAIGDGADAARRSAKLVLLNSGYEAVPSIIDEGRQSINNLERSTTLFLAKTIYASILAVAFAIIPIAYPYTPIEMSLLNFACIGLPGLILALEPNTARIKNQFVKNIISFSVPVGITVSVTMLILAIVANLNSFSRPELLTASLFVTFIIDLAMLYQLCKPLNFLRSALLIVIIAIVIGVYCIPYTRSLLDLSFLLPNSFIATVSLASLGLLLFILLRLLTAKYSQSRK